MERKVRPVRKETAIVAPTIRTVDEIATLHGANGREEVIEVINRIAFCATIDFQKFRSIVAQNKIRRDRSNLVPIIPWVPIDRVAEFTCHRCLRYQNKSM